MTSSHTTPRYRSCQFRRVGCTSFGPHLSIVYVVNFVKNDKLDVSNEISSLVQHTPKDFRGHNKAIRLWIYLDIACKYAHR